MQTPEDKRRAESEELEAPPELVAALKRGSKPDIFIPSTLDETILEFARCQLCPPVKTGFRWTLIIRWAVGAAVLILFLAVISRLKFESRPAGDMNRDGRVDILDAFALARELRDGGHTSRQLDINHDGVVDERDVAALAARAVSLEKGGRS